MIALAIVAALLGGVVLQPIVRDGPHHVTVLTLFGIPLPTICWFKLTTGLPCAGCGLTRSVVLLLHGDLAASLALHPFGVVAVALGLLQLPPRLVRAAGGTSGWIRRWDRLWVASAALTGALMLAWWIHSIGLGWVVPWSY